MVSTELEGLKNDIQSILISNKKGMTEKELSKQYREFCFNPIPYKNQGYHSLSAFLESLSDVVHVSEVNGEYVYSEIPNKDTQHISKLVQSQSNGKNGSRMPTMKELRIKKSKTRQLPNEEIKNIKETLLEFPKGMDEETFFKHYIQRFGRTLDYQKYGFSDLKDCFDSLPHLITIRSKKKENFYCPSKSLLDEISSNSVKNKSIPPLSSVPESIVSNLELLIQDFPEGLDLHLLLDNYKEMYHCRLKFQEYGFNNLSQLFKSLPSVFKMEKRGSNWIISCAESKDKSVVLSEVNENIRTVLEREKGVILSSDIGEFYKKHHTKPINLFPLGFQSMDGLLIHLSSLKDPYFVMEEIAGPRFLVKLLSKSSPVISSSFSSPTSINSVEFPRKAQSELVDIFVEEFNGPVDFYIRFKKYEEELIELMTNLDKYCEKNRTSLRLKDENIRPGSIVAVYYDKSREWHRGEIVELLSPHELTIHYFDYGTTLKGVSRNNLLKLDSSFCSLPKQAIRAKCACSKSLKKHQSFSKSERVALKKILEGPLFAQLVSFDPEGIPEIELFNEKGPERININEAYFRNGIASENYSREKHHHVPLRRPRSQTLDRVSNKSNGIGINRLIIPPDRCLNYIVGAEDYIGENCTGNLVTSADISNLFPKWKRKDVLVAMLRHKGIHVESFNLDRSHCQELWSIAAKSNLPGFKNDKVTLFKLQDVPQIMNIFGNNEKDAIKSISNVLMNEG